MARIWGLSLPMSLIHQVGPGGRKITETSEVRAGGQGSTELHLEQADGVRHS